MRDQTGFKLMAKFNSNSIVKLIVSESAKNQAANNPTRTVYDVKRLIGRKYTDSTV